LEELQAEVNDLKQELGHKQHILESQAKEIEEMKNQISIVKSMV
jgi:hypothetical protein